LVICGCSVNSRRCLVALQGKLVDGCKIAVFGATFTTRDSASGRSTMCLRLTYNNVRKAQHDARLGYISPGHLQPGISIASIRPGRCFANCC
jgi:hypothetical protein